MALKMKRYETKRNSFICKRARVKGNSKGLNTNLGTHSEEPQPQPGVESEAEPEAGSVISGTVNSAAIFQLDRQ